MIKITELAFCCYAVTDIPRARRFYEEVLGLKPTTVFGSNWVEYEFGPYAVSIGCSPEFRPSPDGCAAALEVEDFDDAIAQLKQHNTKFRMEPMDTPVCHGDGFRPGWQHHLHSQCGLRSEWLKVAFQSLSWIHD